MFKISREKQSMKRTYLLPIAQWTPRVSSNLGQFGQMIAQSVLFQHFPAYKLPVTLITAIQVFREIQFDLQMVTGFMSC